MKTYYISFACYDGRSPTGEYFCNNSKLLNTLPDFGQIINYIKIAKQSEG
jgi:hypothetical protein